ncbi:DNA cytosine methyltransferase [Myroides pelagicus]|uniref:DNA cytosine methyltransferase n=1 Tax=Myroides pelagicus TaxID=270914 RepID=UPI002DBD69B9|nr:DNA cytosine methyltransferase [Myroides pelagicus]MEC4114958.1 DNA cytosine methyltransferase [Myroides pelagicus]
MKRKKMTKVLTYISLFSSAGVGCYGFKENGFECIATNELLEKRLQIQKYNNKCQYDSGYISGDITEKETQSKLFAEINRWKKSYSINEPDVLIATPPCQGMSVANHKKNDELKRNSLVVESISITKKVQPKFFVFENVRAFLNTICTDIDDNDKPIKKAILSNLSAKYNIYFKIVNFKDYGAHSSRTRTLVVGVRKDLKGVSPFDIFPKKSNFKTLRELFKDLPQLHNMGEIYQEDIYHSFRTYSEHMLPWIELLDEGQSAFDNLDTLRIPHKVIDGEVVFNANKNGDKYARWYWDREGPCIHTRNDILASQNTVHPSENRVFSIRELMLMMSIPKNFKWTLSDVKDLNELPIEEKKAFLKKEELNIRHCIGEAVPTGVFSNIAKNIKQCLSKVSIKETAIINVIKEYELDNIENLISFIDVHFDHYGIENILQIAEKANSNRQDTAAYFTRKDIAYHLVKDLPLFEKKKSIKVLEPSVGIGNFVYLLFDLYSDKEKVELDVIDIDQNSLEVFKVILSKIKVPSNFVINFINEDFLLSRITTVYDLVIGNPPYYKLTNDKKLLESYKKDIYNSATNNVFSFFIEKALKITKCLAFIVPKSLINAPEFNLTRKLLAEHNLVKICDFGEKGFKGVKIETIGFITDQTTKKTSSTIVIESLITEEYTSKSKEYIFDDQYPYWLLYRDSFFDKIADNLQFSVFTAFRDRQVTKKHTLDKGMYRVLKSRNIGNNEIVDLVNYDCYINSLNDFSVSQYLNKDNVVLVPNLTYYPRAAYLPENSIVDGSVAVLEKKENVRNINDDDIEYFGSKEFSDFYRIARNYGTRSLNIDNNSVFFFGIRQNVEVE